jgi:signal transduction histidine kinase
VSNAIKFSNKNSEILIDVVLFDNKVRVFVQDFGNGIAPDQQAQLFTLEKNSTIGTNNEKGTGLGLVLCKDFVERNAGEIGVESYVGKGSKFYFTIPLATVGK